MTLEEAMVAVGRGALMEGKAELELAGQTFAARRRHGNVCGR